MAKPKNALYQFRGDVEVLSEQVGAVPAIGVGCGVGGAWTDEKSARRQAKDYVSCRGEYGSGMLFSISLDGAAGRVDYRAARVFAKDVLEDGTEKVYCLDEDDPYTSLPRQVEVAYRKAVDERRRFEAGEVKRFDDVAFQLGWEGEGWYTFREYGYDDLPICPEKPHAVWYEGFYEWADDFAECFKHRDAAEVISEHYGSFDFPDSDVDVAGLYEDFDYGAWQSLRELYVVLDSDECALAACDVTIALRTGVCGVPDIVRAVETAREADEDAVYETFRTALDSFYGKERCDE